MLSKIYLLSRIRNKTNVDTAKTIYFSTIQSYFDYIVQVSSSFTQLFSLQMLQNEALRTILKRTKRSNCKKILDYLELLNVN